MTSVVSDRMFEAKGHAAMGQILVKYFLTEDSSQRSKIRSALWNRSLPSLTRQALMELGCVKIYMESLRQHGHIPRSESTKNTMRGASKQRKMNEVYAHSYLLHFN